MSNNIKQLVPKVQIFNYDRLTASVSQLGLSKPRVLIYGQTDSIDKLMNYY